MSADRLAFEVLRDNRAIVTGGKGHWPMVDRHGTPIRVGDTIRYQYCSGRYGQTKVGQPITVTDAHYDYCQIGGAGFHYDFKANVLRGYHQHTDFEHGHETWVEIV